MEDNKTVATYYDKLKKCGISEKCVDTLKEKYGKAIESGSFSTKNDNKKDKKNAYYILYLFFFFQEIAYFKKKEVSLQTSYIFFIEDG